MAGPVSDSAILDALRPIVDREGDVGAVDLDILYEAQIDDALAEVGIHDRSQGIEDGGDG